MPGPVDVWFAHEALLDDAELAERLEALLDPDERARRQRMAHESGRGLATGLAPSTGPRTRSLNKGHRAFGGVS